MGLFHSVASSMRAPFVNIWGTHGGSDGQFRYPRGLAVSSDGIVYVSDWRNSRIQKLTLEGVFVNQWGKWLRKEGTDYGGCLASGHIQLVLNRL